MAAVDCVLRAEALLGESPVWSADEQALYFVDIKKPAIHRFDPAAGRCATWAMPQDIGSMGLRAKGGAVVALRMASGFSISRRRHSSPLPIHCRAGRAFASTMGVVTAQAASGRAP